MSRPPIRSRDDVALDAHGTPVFGPAPMGSLDRHAPMTYAELALLYHGEGGMTPTEAALATGLSVSTLSSILRIHLRAA